MAEYNKRYRDTVFRDYFNNEERLLSLCNALLGTDAVALKINTLEGTFFDRQKNDISCVVENNFLVLIEHQSTINENMPFRCLSYVAELMNNLVVNKRKLYHKALIQFPAPRFYVFYDGDAKEPLQREMRLSDAFDGDNSTLELVVTALNINFGLPQPLLEKCKYLREYSTLVGKVKEGIRAGLTRKEAISRAVKFCLENGLKSVAFCCISTGVFHFPNRRAAEIAVRTVTEWLKDNPGKIERVIFNVFKDEDREYYEEQLR